VFLAAGTYLDERRLERILKAPEPVDYTVPIVVAAVVVALALVAVALIVTRRRPS
jgi:hypothetical protein